jgi:hypothetical protein
MVGRGNDFFKNVFADDLESALLSLYECNEDILALAFFTYVSD